MNQHRMSADGELRLISVHLPVPNSPLKEGHVCMYEFQSSNIRSTTVRELHRSET